MPLSIGTRLGPYEILALIGAGGMGEVYRARDTRLDRTVAIKVIHSGFGSQPDARQRFEREARAVSSLNHPHICTLYDVGQQDSIDFLVMECLEGETLQSRVRRGALPLEEVIRYGVQIASALAEAHQQGILHRDIKPANVMLTKNGVKLLDFGLAKLRTSGPERMSPGSVLETVSLHETGKGTIVGTLQYMAPEQLEAKEVDARTDIFALGLVLYEMVTGNRASNADTQAALIAQIMRAEFEPLTDVPPPFAHVVERCLAVDPAARWHAAADVKLELEWASTWTPPVQAPSVRQSRATRAAAAAGLLLFGLALLWLWTLARDSAKPQRVVRLSINPPAGREFSLENSGALIGGKGGAISPDGRLIVFVMTVKGVDKLWVRKIESLNGTELPGTDGARYPFWSPDSRSIGFFASGKIMRIEVSGGLPSIVCDSPSFRGGSWSSSGVIVFSPNAGPLQRVAVSGGTPAPATTIDATKGENSHRWPYFLPDGRRFLYSIRTAKSAGDGVYAASLDRPGEKIRLAEGSGNTAYAPARNNRGGYLLWARDGRLLAQPFHPERMKLSGEAVVLAEGVETPTSAYYSVSNEGTVLYALAGQTRSKPAWYNREGKHLGGEGPEAVYSEPAISPDGNRLALVRRETSGTADIWLIELSRGAAERLTLHGGIHPAWSPDGRRIAYVSGGRINVIDTNGSGREENLTAAPNAVVTLQNWSPDGKFLLYQYYSYELNWKTRNDLWLLPLNDARKPVAFLQTEFQETSGRFSGDGKWISYTSDQSGADEVYVQPFPADGTRRQVSIGGGEHPRWRKDGKELFYRSASGKLMAVAINGQTFAPPTALFDIGNRAFDVAPDGQRFLVLNPAEPTAVSPMVLLANWEELFTKR